ncbi:Hypothetical protein R9X50_00797000 [Acrodontium crateriforme]|uniref:Uncharacterized protein n=1 Tax=Acrodontium crateriforme TaxID=150365 RepID=A0AAQ3RCM0_9PEZI|nr:Hypothetical protein R9X50_00797000 [Acrodontium crateriforme]
MTALRALLKQKDGVSSTTTEISRHISDLDLDHADDLFDEENSINRVPREITHNLPGHPVQQRSVQRIDYQTTPARNKKDIVDKNILSIEIARELVELFKKELYPVYPIIYLPKNWTADDLRRNKPVLFLAIVAAAAGKNHPDIATRLDQEILEEYANRTVINGEKSLELVQALNVSAVWYQPPNRLSQIKFYEYIHMASMMAPEIGIDRRPLRHFLSLKSNSGLISPDVDLDTGMNSLEARRTLLATQVTCSGVRRTMRRPAMMRVTGYTRDSIELLERSSRAAPGDKVLAASARLMDIADEIANSFEYDDHDALASIYDVKTRMMISAFDKRLSDWHATMPTESYPPVLQMTYQTIRMYLHEVVLHVDHSPEDFKAPYHMGIIHSSCEEHPIPIKAAVDSISALVDSIHALMDLFLDIDVEQVRVLPVASYVRVSYSTFLLAKLSVSGASDNSQLQPLIDRSTLKAESYVSRLLFHLRSSIGRQKCRVPAIFVTLLSQIGQWCSQPELIQEVGFESNRKDREQQNRYEEIAMSSSRSIEDITSPKSSPGSVDTSIPGQRATVLTGSFAANYESIAGEDIVNRTAALGLASQTERSNTESPAQLVTPMSSDKDEGSELLNLRESAVSTSEATEPMTLGFGRELQDNSWPLDLDQMNWAGDDFSYSKHLDPESHGLGDNSVTTTAIDELMNWQ